MADIEVLNIMEMEMSSQGTEPDLPHSELKFFYSH